MAFFEDDRILDMTDEEIKRSVLGAADQKAQIKIVADLNATTEEVIRKRLRAQGVDLRSLRGAVKKHIAERKRKYKKPEVIPAPPKPGKLPTISDAIAVIKAEIAEINRQQYELDMRKADLYHTIWDMLGEVER